MKHVGLLASEAGGAAAEGFEAGWLTRHVWLIPLLPVASFVLTLFLGKRFKGGGAFFGVGLMGLALVLSTALGFEWMGRGHVELEEGQPPAVAATYRGTASGDQEHPVQQVIEDAERTGQPKASIPSHGGSEEKGGEEHALPAGRLSLPTTESGGEAPAGEHHAIEVRPYHEAEAGWFHIGPIEVGFGFHVDGFAVVMLFTVCFISFLVHLFSTEYLRDDRRRTHYFASLGLFTAGMLLMVSSSTSLQLLLGWEIMGLCSFLLIGHWWEESKNSDAALKAFFTTRTGDVGLLVGLSILFFGAGQTFNIAKINQQAITAGIPRTWLVAAAVALFIACIGKSAQFPLHTWLPDAMAGPTPASALIHAATMVVAGVYMVGRFYPVFFSAFRIANNALGFNIVALIGGITIIIAGLLAFVQQDIKKVLAYSTVSQLGYMVMGLGVGAWTGAIFHLFTHAFFKALLFMGAGSISHACWHSFDMRDFGGLRKHMPKTFVTFMIGTAALMGLFPFAGFWSKDEILLGAYSNGYRYTFLIVGSVGAALTCAYMTRVVYKTFFGEYTGPHTPEAIEHAEHAAHAGHGEHGHVTSAAHEEAHAPALVGATPYQEGAKASADSGVKAAAHDTAQAERGPHDDEAEKAHDPHGNEPLGGYPHESPWPITVPLMVLAVMSVVAGIINAPFLGLQFTHFSAIEPIVAAGVPEPLFNVGVAVGTSLAALVGLGIAYGWWFAGARFGLDGISRRNKLAGAGFRLLEQKYYLDALYERVIVRGIKGPVATAAYWFNQNVLDGIIHGTASGARRAASFTYDVLDQEVVDGTVNGVGAGATGLGRGFKHMASGKVQQYVAYLIGGAAAGALVIFAITFNRS
ncbi:MAG: NADH-ubiquinone oxidoreductase chain L [uncultured Acidimicrobiales bacterium]|uniref:NADH-ubiquinone oxidoreductase chain L n=1 Tax=uncultured Acidimicrobiales bacterium TaxID=310071 RepID=A0A6J4JBQ6_9ACTN|nr:MAG: NADH-ubiquinone oxidoreductase chain L [uncultured Acidimicrobiales bacterium]